MTDAPPTFLARLKQHHIYRVAAAYGAAIAVLIQIVARAFPYFGWSAAVPAVIIILIAGFPVALVIAWLWVKPADAGEQSTVRKRNWKLGAIVTPIVIAAVVVSGIYAFRFSAEHEARLAAAQLAATTASTAAPSAATEIPAKSVAVLPFENLSTDKANAYFADGIQDLILTKLADIGDLAVVSRTSTESYGSHPQSLRQIGEQLGVATILEGSVQKAGNQVLINVQLIDAKTDHHIWAQSYQRTLDNIFGVEGEVAEKIATALNAKLTPAETAAVAQVGTHNPAALDAFLKARFYLDDSNRTDDLAELERSVPLFKQAIAADPHYVEAYAYLALAYNKLGGHDRDAEVAVHHALALDPDSADALINYAFLLMHEGKFDAAIAEAEKAVASPTSSAPDIYGLGVVLGNAGRVAESAKAFRRAIEADPRSSFIRLGLAVAMMQLRRYAQARDALRYIVTRDPKDVNAVTALAQVEVFGWGDLAAARTALQSLAMPVASSATLSQAWFDVDFASRDYPAALAVLAKAPLAVFDDAPRALYEARVYRAQGDAAKARVAFEAARDQLDAKLKAAPQSRNLHAYLAQALAGLGDGETAIAEAKRALALPASGDRALGNFDVLTILTSVQAHTGHAADAIQLLGHLLATPAGADVSVADLRINPEWDPIRKDPRFQALLKKYAQHQPSTSAVTTSAASAES